MAADIRNSTKAIDQPAVHEQCKDCWPETKRRELGLLFPVGVGGDLAVHVKAGADPSEESLRTRNTKAWL